MMGYDPYQIKKNMISIEEIQRVLPNALLIIRFEQLPDFGAAFCVDMNDQGQLKGLTLKGVRQGTNDSFFFKEDIVPDIFQPRVSTKKTAQGFKYQLEIQPLQEKIDIVCKTSTTCKCMFPLPEEKKKIKMEHILVSGSLNPLTMDFNIHGSFRKQKDAPKEKHVKKIKAPYEFTQRLYSSLTGI